jgi:AGZA family xanthine/uracil permease-like MFS transporter
MKLNRKLDKYFDLAESGTSVRQEVIGGTTTFMTMAYILFVQPAVMSAAGMDAGAVLIATCLSSAAATIIMGLYARYPVALVFALRYIYIAVSG